MKHLVLETSEQGAQAVVSRIAAVLRAKPDALLCLAAGHSSLPVFTLLLKAQKDHTLDFTHARFVGLDEWLDVPPSCEGACCNFLRRSLFTPLGLREEQLCLFNPLCTDAQAECARVERFIEARGGIDFLLLGIGMNGHLALNEPGERFSARTHAVALSDTTRTVAPKYFPQGTPMPERGITLGLANLIQAKQICLTIFGAHKRGVVERLLNGPVGEDFPASVLQSCENALVVLDRPACGELLPLTTERGSS